MFSRNKSTSTKTDAGKPGASKGLFNTGKGFFDKAWDVAGKYMGEPMNIAAGKLGIEGVWPTTMDRECDKAARILRVFTLDGGVDASESIEKLNVKDVDAKRKTQRVIKRIPAKALREAQGIAIFTVFRSGLGFSAASGSGMVIARKEDGTWGGPSGLLVHTIGFGFMLGIDVYDVVLLLRTPMAVQSFARPKINLGGEIALVAGPLGSAAMADAGYQQAPAWSYVKSKGFYAGVQLDGSVIVARDDENARFYGGSYTAKQILSGGTHIPLDAEGLIQTIEAASDRDTKTDHIPQGLAPSEAVGSTLDIKDKDIHQPTEGFGAPPQYEDLEEINVKCSDCGSSMSMEQLAEHDCSGTTIQPSASVEKRRTVPLPPKPKVPERNSVKLSDAKEQTKDTDPPSHEATFLPAAVLGDTVEDLESTTDDAYHDAEIGKLEEIKLDDASDKIEMTIVDDSLNPRAETPELAVEHITNVQAIGEEVPSSSMENSLEHEKLEVEAHKNVPEHESQATGHEAESH